MARRSSARIGAILALAKKDLVLLVRDRTGLAFTLGVPILFAVFFGTIFGGDDDIESAIPLAVVDLDGSEWSEAFVARLERAEELGITRMDTREAASNAVRLGDYAAYVVIRPDFGRRLRAFFAGEPPEIELGVDPSRRAEAGMLEGVLTRYAVDGMVAMFTNPEVMLPTLRDLREGIRADPGAGVFERETVAVFYDHLDTFLAALDDEIEAAVASAATDGTGTSAGVGFEPIRVVSADVAVGSDGPRTAYDFSFPQGIVWGLITTIMVFATSLVTERTRGTLVRLRMSPLGRIHMLLGKAVACFVTTTAVMVVLFAIGVLVFGIRPMSWPLLALAVICTSAGFVGVMLLLSTFGDNERTTSNIGWAVMMVMAMLGGGMIPLFTMPDWLRAASHVSPLKWAVLSIEGGLWRGFSLAEMLPACAVLLVVGAVCFGIGVKTFKE
jgi:ABC-2 type transport system permease protein